jgi:hypothetical protein
VPTADLSAFGADVPHAWVKKLKSIIGLQWDIPGNFLNFIIVRTADLSAPGGISRIIF